MRTVDKIRAKMSALRAKARELLEIEDRSPGQEAEVRTINTRLIKLEGDYQLALRMDSEPESAAEAAEDKPAEDAEDKPADEAEDKPEDAEDKPADEAAAPRSAGAGAPAARAPQRRGFLRPGDPGSPQAEAAAAGPYPAVHPGSVQGWIGEAREFNDLCCRASVSRFLNTALGRMPAAAADPETELRSALGLTENQIPWGAVLPREALLEMRNADVVGAVPSDIQAAQRPIIRRVFTDTVAAHLGVMVDSVGVGEALYHVLTGGNDALWRANGIEGAASGSTMASASLEPIRLTGAYNLNYKDLATVVGLEEAIRADLGDVMADQLDKSILNGGAEPEIPGMLNDTRDQENYISRDGDPAAVDTWSTSVAKATDKVDGLYAKDVGQIRMVIGPATNGFFEGLVQGNTAVSAMEYITRRIGPGGVMTSSNIPGPASSIQKGLISRVGGTGPNAVCPVWNMGITVIRDEYSRAAFGQVRLQMLGFHNFAVLRSGPFHEIRVRIA